MVMVSTGDCWNIRNWAHNDALFTEHPKGADFVEISSKDLMSAVLAGRAAGIHLPVVGLLAEIAPTVYHARAAWLASQRSEGNA